MIIIHPIHNKAGETDTRYRIEDDGKKCSAFFKSELIASSPFYSTALGILVGTSARKRGCQIIEEATR